MTIRDSERERVEKMAHNIRTFWNSLGYNVNIEIIPIAQRDGNQHHQGTAFGIRSDIIAGLPPNFTAPTLPYLKQRLADFFL